MYLPRSLQLFTVKSKFLKYIIIFPLKVNILSICKKRSCIKYSVQIFEDLLFRCFVIYLVITTPIGHIRSVIPELPTSEDVLLSKYIEDYNTGHRVVSQRWRGGGRNSSVIPELPTSEDVLYCHSQI